MRMKIILLVKCSYVIKSYYQISSGYMKEEEIMKLKKVVAIALAGVMTFSLAACGSSNEGKKETGNSARALPFGHCNVTGLYHHCSPHRNCFCVYDPGT